MVGELLQATEFESTREFNRARRQALLRQLMTTEPHPQGFYPAVHAREMTIANMSDSYRSFARSFFPNAQLVADKFHVLRLLTPAMAYGYKSFRKLQTAAPKLLRLNNFSRVPTIK